MRVLSCSLSGTSARAGGGGGAAIANSSKRPPTRRSPRLTTVARGGGSLFGPGGGGGEGRLIIPGQQRGSGAGGAGGAGGGRLIIPGELVFCHSSSSSPLSTSSSPPPLFLSHRARLSLFSTEILAKKKRTGQGARPGRGGGGPGGGTALGRGGGGRGGGAGGGPGESPNVFGAPPPPPPPGASPIGVTLDAPSTANFRPPPGFMEKGAEASWILGTSGGGVNSSSSSSEPFDIEIALSRIRARAGPWHQLAALLPQLSSAGIDAMAVEVETGLERATQALWQTAAQVFASLESDGLFPAAALPAFDSGPGALALHELRNLPADARRGAAEYLATGGEMVASGEGILEAVDANLASTLARAYREWERRAREREGFSDAPGDVLAFKHWRDAAECRREDAKEEALKRGLAVAVTNTAKDRLESLSTEAIARVVPAAEAAAAAAAAGLLRTSAEGVSCWFFISVFFVLLFSQGRGFRGRQKKLIFSSFIFSSPPLLTHLLRVRDIRDPRAHPRIQAPLPAVELAEYARRGRELHGVAGDERHVGVALDEGLCEGESDPGGASGDEDVPSR